MTSRLQGLAVGALPFAAVLALGSGPAGAQTKQLTLDVIYDPAKKVDFSGMPPTGLEWISDTHYLWPRSDTKTESTEWLRVEALTGSTEPFLDSGRMEAALARAGVSGDEAASLAHRPSYTMNAKRTAVLLTIGGDLYHYELGADDAVRLTFTSEAEELASYSPDGALVAFVRGGNLHLVDVAGRRERPVTTDGSPERLNGKLDWVYEAEVYGRGQHPCYWWSPDSSRIAFLQLDDHGVPRYTLVDDLDPHGKVEVIRYPKAGDPNPRARLAVARVSGGTPTFVDLDAYTPLDLLIVNVGWTPDGEHIAYQVQDREQTWLDLNLADPASGQSRTLLHETSPAWVERRGNPVWLEDGSFLWLSERSGFQHLYHCAADGKRLTAVTDGPWDVRTLHGIDANGWIYFSGTERGPIGVDVYRVRLDGTGRARLSAASGTHGATFSPGFGRYIDRWSDIRTPTQVRLHRADGVEERVIHEGKVEALSEYRLSMPELLQVPTRDGSVMEAMLIKPPDFDPKRRYPVYQHTYGGPQLPQVHDAWLGGSLAREFLFLQLLAQHGIVVWVCDNRTASGKGAASAWPCYKRLGEAELQDIEDGLVWLRRLPWVDPDRIGLSGWSYGGFTVSYALTHSTSFAMGIAGGSITDWRNYNSIYTERLMRLPQVNAEGYRRSAPRLAAKDLHGALLLIHGTLDDVVHPQNTLQLAHELQRAGKAFQLMLYPKSRHGMTDPLLARHLRATMLAFALEKLRPRR